MPPENCELSVRVASVNLLRDILEGGRHKVWIYGENKLHVSI